MTSTPTRLDDHLHRVENGATKPAAVVMAQQCPVLDRPEHGDGGACAHCRGTGMHVLDECRFCLGAKGNVRGNENVVGTIVCCDDCGILVGQALKAAHAPSTHAELEARCTQIADGVVPEYRIGRSYSCTGTIAKRWQAAWDGAYRALRGAPREA